jgi:hypothetical protein
LIGSNCTDVIEGVGIWVNKQLQAVQATHLITWIPALTLQSKVRLNYNFLLIFKGAYERAVDMYRNILETDEIDQLQPISIEFIINQVKYYLLLCHKRRSQNVWYNYLIGILLKIG